MRYNPMPAEFKLIHNWCLFYSAMGYYVYMDENGDVEGNYSLMALCDIDSCKMQYSYPGTLKGHTGTLNKIVLSFSFLNG